MGRKKVAPSLFRQLRLLGAPLEDIFDADCQPFDVLWRRADESMRKMLLQATGRESYEAPPVEPPKLAPPLAGDPVFVPRRIPGTPVPVRATPLESDEFFDPPAKKAPKTRSPRTVWPATTQSRKNAWVPPHMRPKKK